MKKQLWLGIIFSFTIWLLVGCGLGNDDVYEENINESSDLEEEQDTEEEMVKIDGLEYTMTVEKEDEDIHVTLSLRNTLEEVVTVDFSSGHQFDLVIHDKDGHVLYDYAEGMMFTQAFITEKIDPGEELTFTDSWSLEEVSEVSSLRISSQLRIYQIDGANIDGTPFQLEKALSE